jgi:hypothetical protein
MDATEYHKICQDPRALKRYTIEETLKVIPSDLVALRINIDQILSNSPIEKPTEHSGGPDTDYFFVNLSDDDIIQIVETLGDAEVGAVAENGSTTQLASSYATLLDTWNAILMQE